jgi:hypothetical protein
MSDEASQSSHADAGPVQQPVGRPVPEREKDHAPRLGITLSACVLPL